MTPPSIRQGKAVVLKWGLTSGDAGAPYDPPSPPAISIADPKGATRTSGQAMTRIGLGTYSYTYIVPSTGPLGLWTAFVDATDSNGAAAGSMKLAAFLVVS